MLDKNLLRSRFVYLGYNDGQIAKMLGINSATLSRKLAGESEFKCNEIQTLINNGVVNAEQVMAIFFAD